MAIILVTGSAGLIGSESVRFFCDRGYTVVGIDNNMRQVFFGEDASTEWNRAKLSQDYGDKYIHHAVDIRDHEAIADIFKTYSHDISELPPYIYTIIAENPYPSMDTPLNFS
jgi:CDP-paratose 2-epimerase